MCAVRAATYVPSVRSVCPGVLACWRAGVRAHRRLEVARVQGARSEGRPQLFGAAEGLRLGALARHHELRRRRCRGCDLAVGEDDLGREIDGRAVRGVAGLAEGLLDLLDDLGRRLEQQQLAVPHGHVGLGAGRLEAERGLGHGHEHGRLQPRLFARLALQVLQRQRVQQRLRVCGVCG